jgi:hypothetical protein
VAVAVAVAELSPDGKRCCGNRRGEPVQPAEVEVRQLGVVQP